MNKFGTSADNDFTEVTELLRIALCEKEVDEVFKEADLNKDGNIDYDEFIQFWRNNYN